MFERSVDKQIIDGMRNHTANLQNLQGPLTRVFVSHGYHGASLALLAETAGLSKASLYHHFPGGKEQMAVSLVSVAIATAEACAFGYLRGPNPASDRLEKFLDGYLVYTEGGHQPCLLGVLGQNAPDAIRSQIKEQIEAWRIVLESTLSGLRDIKTKRAARLAEETLCSLYGASLLGQITGDSGCLERSIKRLRKLFALHN